MGLDKLGNWLRDPRAKVTIVALVFVGGILASIAAGQSDVVLRGVVVGGIPVSGLDADELVARLKAPADAIQVRKLTLVAGDRSWQTTPVASGIGVDVRATAERALQAGRENPFRWISRTVGGGTLDLPWVPAVDERALDQRMKRLAADVRREAANGAVRFEGPNVVVTPPSEGTALLQEEAAERLVAAAMRPTSSDRMPLPVKVTKPSIDHDDVRPILEQARVLLSAPVGFVVRDQAVELAPVNVAAALRVEAVDAPGRSGQALALRIDADELRRQLVALVPGIERPARDAAFVVAGDKVRLVESQEGWTPETGAAVDQILAFSRGAPRVPIQLPQRPLAPTLTTDAARQLGIVQRISSFRTTFDSRNAPRVANIDRMASAIDGKIVLPGAAFSLNQATGPRTPENGYQEAQVIVDGELVPGIGGGVCQVGTTLFNAVADAGLQVLSRSNHSLYISHYPIGRDATVNYGHVDLKFRNDTPYGLLLKAAVDAKALTVSVYSTPLGRTVTYEVSPQVNPKTPTAKYVDDPAVPTGQEIVTEEGKPGFDITVLRKVVAGDKVLHEDKFVSKYRPWKRIVRRGTGPAVSPPPSPTPSQPAPPAPAPPVPPAQTAPAA